MQSQGKGPSWHAAMVFCNSTFSSSSCCLLCLLCNSELRRVREGHGNGGKSLQKKHQTETNYTNSSKYMYVYVYMYIYVKIICMFATQIVAGFHPSKRCCSLGVNDHKQVRNVWNQALRQQQQRIDVHVIYVSCCSSCPKGNGVTSKKK